MSDPDLSPDELREHGSAVVQWITDYLAGIENRPVLATVQPGDVMRSLPATPPAEPESMDVILKDFEEKILPGITHWNHPGFLAYFANTGSAPGIIGEMLTAALNVNGMLWVTSPAATELEQLSLDWLRQMMGLGDGWFGIINDTASISTFVALAAAREAKPELDVRGRGMAGRSDLPALRVYTSAHSHSSVDKAAMALGLGLENVVHIECDEAYRMHPEALRLAIRQDRDRGFLPIAVVATVGTTSSTSIDPVREIAEVSRSAGAWLHVDGAYGGIGAIVPEMRGILDGVELADSFVVNPHKWLFTPMDCSVLFTRQPDVLKRAFSLVPDYLVTERADSLNLMDYGIQLGRRFRALKLWMIIRAFGSTGLAARIRHHCQLARDLATQVAATPGWKIVAPVPFSVVCMRYAPPGLSVTDADAVNEAIMRAVNASGRVFLSHTRLDGRYVIRVAIGNLHTDRRHIDEAWQLLRDAASSFGSR
jgi:aromatic-L-amino-acid decarboxylase